MDDIPRPLSDEIDELVREGRFPSRPAAIAALLRIGLDQVRDRGGGGGPPARRPPRPPGTGEPEDDRPISVNPSDPQWL